MGAGHDDTGRQVQPPDFSRFDEWVARWPAARRRAIFLNLRADLGGHRPTSPAGRQAVRDWLKSFEAHVVSAGLDPKSILIMPQDEPRTDEMMQLAAQWGQAIAAADTSFVTWTNPVHGFVGQTLQDAGVSQAYDVLCINRGQYFLHGDKHLGPFLQAREHGKALEVYSCDDPAPVYDPYTYYRLQAWFCFEVGARASYFWSFGDNGKRRSDWRQYGPDTRSFTPFFLDDESVTPAKGIEAIRAGVQDYHYLQALKRSAEALRQANRQDQAHQAQALLDEALKEVSGALGARHYNWLDSKDRSAADRMRIRIGEFLEGL